MRFTWWQYVTWSRKLANTSPGSQQHPVKMLPSTCMVMSSATPTWVYFRQHIVLNGKEDIQDYVEIKLPSSNNNNASCVVSSAIILLAFITSAILISSVRPVGVGEGQRSQQTEVRTQEREAECNRGRTTCRPAWDVLIGSSRSGGPGSLPASPACGFCGRGRGGNERINNVNNWSHLPGINVFLLFKHDQGWDLNKSSDVFGPPLTFHVTHISIVRSFRKSLCSGFSTSTTPQGYRRPLTFFPLASICWLDPTTANGILVWKRWFKTRKTTLERSLQYPMGNFTEFRVDYLQDPRLLFEILILIRLGIRKVVNFDSVFIDLIQDLSSRARKHL